MRSDESNVYAAIEPSRRTIATLLNKNEGGAVHSLPCTIHHDGNSVAVGIYFRPINAITSENDIASNSQTCGKYVAQLRGRKLLGDRVKLPKNVAGWVLAPQGKKANLPSHEFNTTGSDNAGVLIDSVFNTLTEWGHDVSPMDERCGFLTLSASKMHRASEWLDFSNAVSAY